MLLDSGIRARQKAARARTDAEITRRLDELFADEYLRLEAMPGNVRLRRGEGGLPRASVVNVSQLSTVDRSSLRSHAGRLTRARMTEIWSGIRLLLERTAD